MDSKKHVDFISAIVFLALSVYVIYSGIGYYQAIQVRGATPFYESPGFFPVIIGCGLLVCSMMLLVRSLKGGAFSENIQKLKEGGVQFAKSPTALKALIGCTWMGIYVYFFLSYLGFVVGTMIFLLGLMIFLQADKIFKAEKKAALRTLVKIVVVSAASVGFTYTIFQTIFRVPLP